MEFRHNKLLRPGENLLPGGMRCREEIAHLKHVLCANNRQGRAALSRFHRKNGLKQLPHKDSSRDEKEHGETENGSQEKWAKDRQSLRD